MNLQSSIQLICVILDARGTAFRLAFAGNGNRGIGIIASYSGLEFLGPWKVLSFLKNTKIFAGKPKFLAARLVNVDEIHSSVVPIFS